MKEYCKNLISNGVPSWIVEEAYKFTIEPLKPTEGLVGIDKENSELYRNVIIAAYIEGANATLEKCKDIMAVRNIVRQWNEATGGYSYRFKGGDIFLRLVKADGIYELRNPIGYGVQVVKCKDLDEADAKAKEVLEAFFEDKVNIKVI